MLAEIMSATYLDSTTLEKSAINIIEIFCENPQFFSMAGLYTNF